MQLPILSLLSLTLLTLTTATPITTPSTTLQTTTSTTNTNHAIAHETRTSLLKRWWKEGEVEDSIREAVREDPDLQLNPEYEDTDFARFVEAVKEEMRAEKEMGELRVQK